MLYWLYNLKKDRIVSTKSQLSDCVCVGMSVSYFELGMCSNIFLYFLVFIILSHNQSHMNSCPFLCYFQYDPEQNIYFN